jgi:hypothetical protein
VRIWGKGVEEISLAHTILELNKFGVRLEEIKFLVFFMCEEGTMEYVFMIEKEHD